MTPDDNQRMADECGQDHESVEKIMKKFVKDDKVLVQNYQVFVRGFMMMTSPKGLNQVTKDKLRSDKNRLYPDIHKAVLSEIAGIGYFVEVKSYDL